VDRPPATQSRRRTGHPSAPLRTEQICAFLEHSDTGPNGDWDAGQRRDRGVGGRREDPGLTTHNDSAASNRPQRRHERVRQIRVGAAVMIRTSDAGPELLLAQRPPGEALAGFWEFPGGKLEAGETALHAVVREVREELGVDIEAIELMAEETHLYPHGLQVVLSFVRCTAPTGQLQSLDGQAFRWVLLTEVNPDELLEADRPFIRRLIENEG
jgi:8-oxo-dGTP diphosphatase